MQRKALYIILYLFSLLPFWVLYRISDFFYLLLYYVVGYRKKVVYDNLKNSFPEKSEEEIKSITKRFYRFFPDIIVEAIKMTSISKKTLLNRFEILNKEEVTRHFNKGRSVMGVTAHYGNWELGIHRLSLMVEEPVLIVYKPLNNKTFDTIYNQIRRRFGAVMVPMKQILRHEMRMRNKPHISIFVADQTPVHQDSDYFLDFLNQETLVYTGTERIAKATDSAVVFCEIGRKKTRGHYYCKFTTLIENPKEYAQHEITHIHNKFTEDIIKENPEYWLWTHRRWKRKRRY